MTVQKSSYNQKVASLCLALMLPLAGCAQAIGPQELPDEEMSEEQGQLTDGPGDNATQTAPAVPDPQPSAPNPTPSERDQILAKYTHLDPNKVVPTKLLEEAVVYFETHISNFTNKSYFSVIDFSKRSTTARFFIIHVPTGSVWAIHTSHGKGSDPEHDGYANADRFSNVSGSNASSLGVYRTAETYYGSHGYSLRLDGLSSTNSRARARAVVIHGASYVKEASVIQGRSWGCPAVAMEIRDTVINKIKNGSLIYAGLSL